MNDKKLNDILKQIDKTGEKRQELLDDIDNYLKEGEISSAVVTLTNHIKLLDGLVKELLLLTIQNIRTISILEGQDLNLGLKIEAIAGIITHPFVEEKTLNEMVENMSKEFLENMEKERKTTSE